MSKELRFRSGGQLLPSCDGAWKQQHHGGPAAWMLLDTKHSRGVWALIVLVVVLLLVSSVSRVNDGSLQAGEASMQSCMLLPVVASSKHDPLDTCT
jgi:hypothetical protein